ncbi:MAG: hypothetical protein KC729_17525 [Candidatus Eisenbacteria bacterium]|uniref:Uncharacterized protein n=1 Tax=Eiseniibacteriota bacterium TaxID=2212470 RepID=A0A956RRE3_UNCEI|nr:hypothetical protein [Candidatus Eisenbacteria bacterium]
MTKILTVLDGSLQRNHDDTWSWRDGSLEPRVTSVYLRDLYQFPVLRPESADACVEVPVERADRDFVALGWVLEERFPTVPVQDPDRPGTIRDVCLVPAPEWERRNQIPVGVAWLRGGDGGVEELIFVD